jgi:hypothetical protein
VKYLAPDLASPPSRRITCIAHARGDMQEHDHPISFVSIDSWLRHCCAGCAAVCPRYRADGIIRLFPPAPLLSLKTCERPSFVWHCHFSIQEICSHEAPTQESGDVSHLTRIASCRSFDPAVIVRYFHSRLSAAVDHLVDDEGNTADELMRCRSGTKSK